MGSEPDWETTLRAIQRRWEAITDVPEQPRSVMNVVEYGLGKQRRAEVYVNRLLRYFLDSSEPHGMGTDFLRVVLESLPTECEFQEDIYDLSDVEVGEQVTVRNTGENPGYLDLLIHVPGEWFLLTELKFAAEERGTEFYCEADELDGRAKTEYESGEYYLYLHRRDKPEASGKCFTNWTWTDFVDDVVRPFLATHGARYPQRTTNQLREFIYDIEQITGMSDHEQSRDEKAELFIDHYETLTDLDSAFEERWEEFANEWYELLPERFGDESTIDEWVLYQHSTDWAFIFKHGWWRRVDTFDPVDRPVESNRVRVGFLHRLEQNRDLAIRDQELKFYFRNTPPNRHTENETTNFRDLFIERFDARKDEIVTALPECSQLTGNMHNRIEATYPIPVDEHETFFNAYLAALETAFREHAIENPELVDLLDDAYYETLDEFRE